MTTWKKIKDYENYEVSNSGKVRNKLTGRILTPKINSTGFLCVNLFKNCKGKSFTVHSLIAKEFLINDENKKRYIIHINGDNLDNNLNNLIYLDLKRNVPKKVKVKKHYDDSNDCLEILFD